MAAYKEIDRISRLLVHQRFALVGLLCMCLVGVAFEGAYAQRSQNREQATSRRKRAITKQSMTNWESKHYKVYTNAKREDVEKYVEHLDTVFEAYVDFFEGYKPRKRARKNVYILESWQDMVDFLKHYGVDGRHASGLFVQGGKLEGLVIFLGGHSEGSVKALLRHEGFHQAAHHFMGDGLPTWMNEGLAEYFENSWVVDGRVVKGVVNMMRVANMKAAIEQDKYMPLGNLLQMSGRQWSANMKQNIGSRRAKRSSNVTGGGHQYTQSWLVVHFFRHHEKQVVRDAFAKYMKAIGKGKTHKQAYNAAFTGVKMRDLETYWKEYVLNLEQDRFGEARFEIEFLAIVVNRFVQSKGNMLYRFNDQQLLSQLKDSEVTESVMVDRLDMRYVSTTDEDVWSYRDEEGNQTPYKIEKKKIADRTEVWITAEKVKPSMRAKIVIGQGGLKLGYKLDYAWDGFVYKRPEEKRTR
ncbi:DUF1570 domain-containing protein [Planctomycetota bacterium]|nr:DUF1570 domain-containing protein [Planctomycetota bacterium]